MERTEPIGTPISTIPHEVMPKDTVRETASGEGEAKATNNRKSGGEIEGAARPAGLVHPPQDSEKVRAFATALVEKLGQNMEILTHREALLDERIEQGLPLDPAGLDSLMANGTLRLPIEGMNVDDLGSTVAELIRSVGHGFVYLETVLGRLREISSRDPLSERWTDLLLDEVRRMRMESNDLYRILQETASPATIRSPDGAEHASNVKDTKQPSG